jgi:histidinol-phosphate aminotransferase
MIDTGRDGRGVMLGMQQKNVYIGRTWPIWPNAVRITVGTPAEMAKFQDAFKQVMTAPAINTAQIESAQIKGIFPDPLNPSNTPFA